MKNERATKKQRELLEYVTDFIREHDYGPSYREIMRALDYKSVSTVATHVNGLVAKGYLSRKDNSPRSLEVGTISNKHTKTTPDEIIQASRRLLAEGTPEANESLQAVIATLRVLGRNDDADMLETDIRKKERSS